MRKGKRGKGKGKKKEKITLKPKLKKQYQKCFKQTQGDLEVDLFILLKSKNFRWGQKYESYN